MEIRFLICQSLRTIASEWAHVHSSMCLLYQALDSYGIFGSTFQPELDLIQQLLDTTDDATQISEMEDNNEPLSLQAIRKMIQAVFEIRGLCLVRAHSVLVAMAGKYQNQQKLWNFKQSYDMNIKHQLITQLSNLSNYIQNTTHPLNMAWHRQHCKLNA
jgi:hypothetical protein